MRLTKLSLLLLVPCALFVSTGCDDDSGETPPENGPDTEGSLVVGENDLTFDRTGGRKNVVVDTNQGMVELDLGGVKWYTATVTNTTGEKVKIEVNCQEFKVSEPEQPTDYDPRTATLKVMAAGITKELLITQTPPDLLRYTYSSYLNGAAVNKIPTASWQQPYRCDYEGTGQSDMAVQFVTNGEYTVEMPWWIERVEERLQKAATDANMVKDFQENANESKADKALAGTKLVSEHFRVLANYDDPDRNDDPKGNPTNERRGEIKFTLGDQSFRIQVAQYKSGFDFSAMPHVAQDVCNEMKLGWTFTDCWKSEAQGQVQNGLLGKVKNAGFNWVRLPCPFVEMGGADFNSEMLNGVKTTAEAAIKEGMYVMVSLTDDGWLSDHLVPGDTASVFAVYYDMWTRIAEGLNGDATSGFDEHLLFEGYDELNVVNGNSQIYERLTAQFIQAVRRTGKNNMRRIVVFPGIYDDQGTVAYLQRPTNDPCSPKASGGKQPLTGHRYAASFKFFKPERYARVYDVGITDTEVQKVLWGELWKPVDGCENFGQDNDGYMGFNEEAMKKYFCGEGPSSTKPCIANVISGCAKIMTGFGTVRHFSDDDTGPKTQSEGYYANYVTRNANAIKVPACVYDDNDRRSGGFGFIVRNPQDDASSYLSFPRSLYLDGMVKGIAGEELLLGDDTQGTQGN